MSFRPVGELTDQELATEASRLTKRVLLILDQYGHRHPELPMWHLFARTLRDSLADLESKIDLLKAPPASKESQ